jgi:hypothetical protein
MREVARFAGAVAVIALVALVTAQGPTLGPTRFVDATVVAVAAAAATACAVVEDVRRARGRGVGSRRRVDRRRRVERVSGADVDVTARSPVEARRGV